MRYLCSCDYYIVSSIQYGQALVMAISSVCCIQRVVYGESVQSKRTYASRCHRCDRCDCCIASTQSGQALAPWPSPPSACDSDTDRRISHSADRARNLTYIITQREKKMREIIKKNLKKETNMLAQIEKEGCEYGCLVIRARIA